MSAIKLRDLIYIQKNRTFEAEQVYSYSTDIKTFSFAIARSTKFRCRFELEFFIKFKFLYVSYNFLLSQTNSNSD